jgi:membrane protein implicated in regulation of membrane protease activity
MVEFNLVLGLILALIGVIALGLEFAHPGALLFIPGTVLILGGTIYAFLPLSVSLSGLGVLIVVIGAIVGGLVEIPYLKWRAPTHKPLSSTSAGFEGEQAIVTVTIVPNTLKGKVRIHSEIWSADAKTPIPAGTPVRVVKGEGVTLYVEPVELGKGS